MLDLLTLKTEDLGVVENLKTHGITITLSGIIIVFSMPYIYSTKYLTVIFLMYCL